tara:strand:- start:5422 stop:6921 length:1500 start_codon:yes stop_codon:yes gene_type:complete
MGIKRFYATKDNTITNAYANNLTTRGTGSNMGASDILEVFNLYAQSSTSSQEASRILIDFPVIGTTTTSISGSRDEGEIPLSGAVNFYLRLYDAPHSTTTPTDFTLVASAISSSWTEGIGLDMEDYTDLGASNWLENTASSNDWKNEGGDFLTGTAAGQLGNTLAPSTKQTFSTGLEDLHMDVTAQMEEWLNTNTSSYGFGVYLTGSQELSGSTTSYYTKRFFARGSQYFFSRPVIEARWDDARSDNRGDFYASSSLVSADDNLNTLYFYNRVRGTLKNIPTLTNDFMLVTLHANALTSSLSSSFSASLAYINGQNLTGVYTASVYMSTTASVVYDVWSTGASQPADDGDRDTQYFTGSIEVNRFDDRGDDEEPVYVCNITNLKKEYSVKENARFRLFVRDKNWSPNVYTVATKTATSVTVPNIYYKLYRVVDELTIVNYGTGSTSEPAHTKLSYDISGSYFNFDMSILESDFKYGLKFLYKYGTAYKEFDEVFTFRVG